MAAAAAALGRPDRRHPARAVGRGGGRAGGRHSARPVQLRPARQPVQRLGDLCQEPARQPLPPHSAPHLCVAQGQSHRRHHSALHLRRGRHPQFRVQSARRGRADGHSDRAVSGRHVYDERPAVAGCDGLPAHRGAVVRRVLPQDLLALSGRGRGRGRADHLRAGKSHRRARRARLRARALRGRQVRRKEQSLFPPVGQAGQAPVGLLGIRDASDLPTGYGHHPVRRGRNRERPHDPRLLPRLCDLQRIPGVAGAFAGPRAVGDEQGRRVHGPRGLHPERQGGGRRAGREAICPRRHRV